VYAGVMHLLKQMTVKGAFPKCAPKTAMPKDQVTSWWSEVDCVNCRPYRFMPVDDEIGGKKMFRVDGQPDDINPTVDLTQERAKSTPGVRTVRRRRPRARG
jgi:hypothetical protein